MCLNLAKKLGFWEHCAGGSSRHAAVDGGAICGFEIRACALGFVQLASRTGLRSVAAILHSSRPSAHARSRTGGRAGRLTLPDMPSDPNIPDAFDVLTVVVLRRPPDASEMSDEELDELQSRHLAYRAKLVREGVLVANGPFDQQSDPSYRGMSVFACSASEAARLSDGDPSVVVGRLAYDVMEWWVRAGTIAFPLADRPVGDRRLMPDE